MSDVLSDQPDTLEHYKSEHRSPHAWSRAVLYEQRGDRGCHFIRLGLACSRAQIRDCLGMLERGGLIEMSKVVTLVVVRLTAKGEEVGNGLVLAEGVLKPGVDCLY